MDTKEQVLELLSRPNGSQTIEIEEAWDGALELLKEGNAAALSFFVRAAKQERYRERINEVLGDRSLLHALLLSEEAKVRKNAARLAGALAREEDTLPLMQALREETVRMVRPSQLLALGMMQTRQAEEFLRTYVVEKAANAGEEKHVREEIAALSTAKASYTSVKRHAFCGLPEETLCELRCAPSMEEALISELRSVRIPAKTMGRGRVRAKLNTYQALMNVRLWRELLLPVADAVAFDPETIGHTAGETLLRLMKRSHRGEPPFAYRIEVKGRQIDRGAFARGIVRAIEETMPQSMLLNAPSAYEAELRVEPGAEKCRLYIKLYTAPDTRFSYRLQTVAASIHPTVAAGVMRLASSWFKPGARVLDPCCGSGTMLIERAMYDTCSELVGVDIASSAITIAKGNMKAAGLRANLMVKDALRFEARDKYDEVISNLPFGNRVGSHEVNQKLYGGLLDKLPGWLKKDGVAVFYTMELRLLEEEIAKRIKTLRLVRRLRTEAGGLEPGIFILQMKV